MQKVYLVQSFHCFELVSQIKEGWSCTRVILPASQHHVVPTFHLKQVGTWYTYGILNQIETKHMSCFHDELIAITQNCLTCYFLECGYANRYANIFQILNWTMKISVKKGINSITDGEKDAIVWSFLISY